MDRGHEAAGDSQSVLEHLGHGHEAVGRAGRVGDYPVLGRVILLLVHAHDNGDVLALGGCRDDHPLGATGQVCLGLLRVGKDAGGLDHELCPDIAPGDLGWILLREHLDSLTIDDERVLLRLHRAREPPVSGVVPEKESVGLGVGEVVDRHDLQFVRVSLQHCLEGLAPDAPESIDADLHCHVLLLSSPTAIRDLFPFDADVVRRKMPVDLCRATCRES